MPAIQKPVQLRHEVVVITGASSGVGRAAAQRFAREGAWIGLLASDAARLEEAKREIEKLGGKAVFHVGDVANADAHDRIAELTEQTFGAIDIWINNAMTAVFSTVWDLPADEFRRVTEVTYLGAVFGTQAALRRMRPRNHGTIVQIGSALAYRSIPFQSAYCGAKHAVRGFTESLRRELKHEQLDIRLSMVQLPVVSTPQFTWAQGRLGEVPTLPTQVNQPEVVADAIWWAAHHARPEVYVGYRTSLGIKLDKLVPAVFDRLFAKRSFADPQPARKPAAQPEVSRRPPKDLYAASGSFGADSESRALQLTVSKHRSAWLWAFFGMASAMAFGWRRKNMVRPPVWTRR